MPEWESSPPGLPGDQVPAGHDQDPGVRGHPGEIQQLPPGRGGVRGSSRAVGNNSRQRSNWISHHAPWWDAIYWSCHFPQKFESSVWFDTLLLIVADNGDGLCNSFDTTAACDAVLNVDEDDADSGLHNTPDILNIINNNNNNISDHMVDTSLDVLTHDSLYESLKYQQGNCFLHFLPHIYFARDLFKPWLSKSSHKAEHLKTAKISLTKSPQPSQSAAYEKLQFRLNANRFKITGLQQPTILSCFYWWLSTFSNEAKMQRIRLCFIHVKACQFLEKTMQGCPP